MSASIDFSTPDAVVMELGEDYREIRESVRRVCADFPNEYWAAMDEKEEYPQEFIQALTDAGFLAALIPEEYGGTGMPLRAAAVIMEEVCAAGCHAAAGHAQMYIMGTILRHGSAQQKKDYLPKIASGELRLQAFGVTEPTSGTDTLSLRTTARREGDHYVINGQKIWTSRSEHSDLMLLLARTTPKDQVKKKTDGLSLFLLDMKDQKDNITIVPIETMVNHATTEVFFNNVEIPVENLIGEEGKGFKYVLSGMNAERVLVASESIGDGYYFVDHAVQYANERVVFDRPIGQNQGVQFPIAAAYMDIEAAKLMRDRAAELFDSGQKVGAEANIAKYLASTAAWKAANATMDTYGGYGYATEYHVERKFKEARLFMIAPISNNLVLSFVAQHVLGLPRSF